MPKFLYFFPPSFLFFVTSKSIIVYCAKPQDSRLKRPLMMLGADASLLGTCWENDRKPQIIIFIIRRMVSACHLSFVPTLHSLGYLDQRQMKTPFLLLWLENKALLNEVFLKTQITIFTKKDRFFSLLLVPAFYSRGKV